ncbi:MAG: FAD-dependent oxidoreductase, partial [Cellvibrionales bacterium]|nr:FAD-dependent oxidoreductase [Cellvibrionales bacterium]
MATDETIINIVPAPKEETIAVVGSGPVGVHFVNELLAQNPHCQIHLFGEEESRPYNRIALSQLLSGEFHLDDISLDLKSSSHLTTHFGTRVNKIHDDSLITALGELYSFDKVVLATGSSAHIPNIDNVDKKGVYVLRTLRDTEALLSRRIGSRHTVVLGGGLLGIEAAKAMRKDSTNVTLIHHSPWLMNHQLDDIGGQQLKRTLEDKGIQVKTSESIRRIIGDEKLTELELRSGERVICDTLIIATGISPNIELASNAGLSVGRGIKINEKLETSKANIFAIGECAEYQGEVVGLVAPGLEQASILAQRLSGKESNFKKKTQRFQLKVLDKSVLSAGKIGSRFQSSDSETLTYQQDDQHRAIRLENGRIKGMASIGIWDQGLEVKQLIDDNHRLRFWQKQRFLRTGNINRPSSEIPDQQIICNCKQISAGQIKACVAQGKPIQSTGAGSVCGSCEILFSRFDQSTITSSIKKETALILVAGLGIALLALFALLNPFGTTESYQPDHISHFWHDSFYRQITGFSILAITVLSFLFSLRKRINWLNKLSFGPLRLFHGLMATLALALLFLHTGVSDFQGVNQWLLYSFFGATIFGAISGLFADFEKRFNSLGIKKAKGVAVFAHIVTFWPLPVLLGFHILSVYW